MVLETAASASTRGEAWHFHVPDQTLNDALCREFVHEKTAEANEGHCNLGIAKHEMDGKKYFLKFGSRGKLDDDFRVGLQLAALREAYPYFVDVHALLRCKLSEEVQVTFERGALVSGDVFDVMIADFAGENLGVL